MAYGFVQRVSPPASHDGIRHRIGEGRTLWEGGARSNSWRREIDVHDVGGGTDWSGQLDVDEQTDEVDSIFRGPKRAMIGKKSH